MVGKNQNIKVDFTDLVRVIKQLEKKLDDQQEAWELTIRKETNHYMLKGMPGEYTHPITWAIEEDEKDELKADKRMLGDVMEYFSIRGLKIVKERNK